MSVPDHVHDSIDAIVDLHSQAERDKSWHQRGVERVAWVLGRPFSLYVLAVISIAWVGTNVAMPHFGMRAFDPPPFPLFEALVSIVALTVAIMVLTVQNHQASIGIKRSNLDLQINLLSERKATKMIELLETLRRDMPSVANREDAEATEMSTALDPKLVMNALDASLEGNPEPREPSRLDGSRK